MDVPASHEPAPEQLNLLTDTLGELLQAGDILDVEDLREATETLLPALYEVLRALGYGG